MLSITACLPQRRPKLQQCEQILQHRYSNSKFIRRAGGPMGTPNETNIRGGGKTVNVVFIYLSRSLLVERDEGWRSNTSPHSSTTPFPSWSVFISCKDDVTVLLLIGVFFVDTPCPTMKRMPPPLQIYKADNHGKTSQIISIRLSACLCVSW